MKVLMLLLALSSFSAFAIECEDFGQQTRVQQCQMDRADRILTATYNAIMGKLAGAESTDFRAGQRLWNQMRDKHCSVEGRLFPAEIGITVKTCKTRLAESRNKELEGLLAVMNAE